MLEISKNANPNYLCKVVQLKGLKKHPNADRLQMVSIDFNNVITGMDANEGDIYVYFPVEGKISKDLLSFTNSFRDKTLNADPEKVGFFEDNCRVKGVKLRGEYSMGYIIPIHQVLNWAGNTTYKQNCNVFDLGKVGTEFDTVCGKLIVEKYQIPVRQNNNTRQGKKPKLSRLVEGQVHLHIDTENLRKNSHKVLPDDIISITYKTHGTSFWTSNVLVKRKLSLLEKVCKFFGANVQELEYDLVYGSRKVVKNSELKNSYYNMNIFGKIKYYLTYLIT